MSSDILFDNFVITDTEELANAWAAQTYDLKRKQIDKDAVSFYFIFIRFNKLYYKF